MKRTMAKLSKFGKKEILPRIKPILGVAFPMNASETFLAERDDNICSMTHKIEVFPEHSSLEEAPGKRIQSALPSGGNRADLV
jgi:hypothetical protein